MTEALRYDLTRPPPLKPRERAALRGAAARAAEALGVLATEYLGRAVSVAVADAGCAAGAGDGPACEGRWAWVVAPAAGRAAVWRIETPLASALVEVMVGSPPQGRAAHERSLSRLDGHLLALLCEELAAAVAAVWPGAAPAGATWRCIHASRDLSAPDAREWATLAFEVRTHNLRGRLELFLPTQVALQAVPQAPESGSAQRPARLEAPGVRAALVTATVRLGTWRTTLRELTLLKRGAMIPLGRSPQSPLELSVAGVATLPVQPGTSNGHVSVQVTGGPLPAE